MSKHGRTKLPPSKTMSRKEKRKAERKLKKQRKDAYTHKDFGLIKELKTVDTAFKAKNAKAKVERLKAKKEKKKVVKKEEKKEVEDSRIQGLKLAIKNDEKELKQLAKNLKFRKKKGVTTLPKSFMNDGLDYILDATDSEKIATFEDGVPSGLEALAARGGAGSDSETESDEEMVMPESNDEEEEEDMSEGDGMDFMSSGEESEEDETEPSKWDPKAKAEKSILKTETTKEKKKRSVQFNVESSETESDPFEDEFSDLEFVGGDGSSSEGEVEEEKGGGGGSLFDEDHDEDNQDNVEHDNEEALVSDEDNNDDSEIHEEESDGDEGGDVITKGKKRKLEAEDDSKLKEDIYGRLRDKDGNIVKAATVGSYVPPAKRAMMAAAGNEQLKKKLKGLLNKVSEGSMKVISGEVEALYLDHSRNDVNETMTSLIMEALVTPTLSPERIVAETVMLIAILHSNVGTEIGAFFIQTVVQRFDALMMEALYGHGKLMENVLLVIANVYNFKIIESKLIFGIMEKFIATFEDRDIELLLLLLKTVGFSLRKDDPARLKQAITDIQAKARALETSAQTGVQARIRFMLDVLVAVRNNNMRKIPSYDPSHIEHLRRVIKGFLKGSGLGEDQLSITLEDLLKADQVGRWWIVGSAWEGRRSDDVLKEAKTKTETSVSSGTFSKQMLRMAKLQGMNTDIRRHVFCILGTSEDFEDAFARLMRLGLNRSQEREIIHVLMHCCLHEGDYNPYYSFLAAKFCAFDRRFAMTVQFSMWDKFKDLDTMGVNSRTKLAHLLSHLLLAKGLSLSVFKVIEFGMESKKTIRFLSSVLTELLGSPNDTTVMEAFQRIAPFPKLKPLRQGLQVFMRVHLRSKKLQGQASVMLLERVERAEAAMFSHHSSHSLL